MALAAPSCVTVLSTCSPELKTLCPCCCVQSLRRESPRLGGSFANWGLTFSCFDCSLQYIRKKVRTVLRCGAVRADSGCRCRVMDTPARLTPLRVRG